LLVRIRQTQSIGHFDNQTPTELEDANLEFNCPHARETFRYRPHLSNETVEASRLLCRDERNRGVCAQEVQVQTMPDRNRDQGRTSRDFEGKDKVELWPYILCQSRYIDFSRCESPNKIEWKALSTWPKERPNDEWGPVEKTEDTRPAVDLRSMQLISARFDGCTNSKVMKKEEEGAEEKAAQAEEKR
jgi:hypothetical protein